MKMKFVATSVNSKTLADEVHQSVIDSILDTGLNWTSDAQRESFVELLDEVMADFAQENKIEQWDVCCDSRNNTITAVNEEKFVLEVKFKQRHCINTTVLRYDIDCSDSEILDIFDLI